MLGNLSFTGTQVFISLLALLAIFLIIILVGRFQLSKYVGINLKALHKNDPKSMGINSRSKYPEVDVFRNSSLFWKLGLVMVLGLAVVSFNWTVFEEKVEIPQGAMDLDFDLEMEAPPQTSTPPPPPPPPPPVIEEVPDDVVLLEEPEAFQDASVSADMAIVDAPVAAEETHAPAPPPPPPPPPALEVKEIFKVVEEMPRFPGCEDLSDKEEKIKCSQKKMLEFIYSNIKYPDFARTNNIQGTVVARFVVDENGKIGQSEIVRDIGGGCGQEALRIVNMMNDLPQAWIPGKQRGRKVKVYFNLPVKFKLMTGA